MEGVAGAYRGAEDKQKCRQGARAAYSREPFGPRRGSGDEVGIAVRSAKTARKT